MKSFEKVWKNIKAHEGKIFYTKKGIPFTYRTADTTIFIDCKHCQISKAMIERAVRLLNPTIARFLEESVTGPSYVYGLITDSRIMK